MSGRKIITREDIAILKHKKKKIIRRNVTCVCFVVMLAGCLVVYSLFGRDADNSEAHNIVATNCDASDTDTSDHNPVASDNIQTIENNLTENDISGLSDGITASTEDILEETTTGAELPEGEATTEKVDISEITFEVPKTSLKDVDEIEGCNWANEGEYTKADAPVALTYFDSTLFIGDSRTEGLILYGGLPNLNGFCYKGLSLDKLESDAKISIPGIKGKFTCYEAIDKTFYDNYYLMFGVNELGWVYLQTFIDDFSDLIDHIYEVNPDANIYVQSILPVTKSTSDSDAIYRQDKINEYNDALLEMCMDRKDIIYLDLASAVMNEDGYLPDEATTDGIHCNADYCKRMIEYIRLNTYQRLDK